MPLLDKIREDKLIELAHAHSGLTPNGAELKVLRDSASSNDPPIPAADAPRPAVRGDFLRWLATNPEAALRIDPIGLRVFDATITGDLNLEQCKIACAMAFANCVFQGAIVLLSAETRTISIAGSTLAKGFNADGVAVHGPLFLRGIQSDGEIRLVGAHIADNLELTGSTLNAKGNALFADGASIGGNVLLNPSFVSMGVISLQGAGIAGTLDFGGARLMARGTALSADGVKVGGDVEFRKSFRSEGVIRLQGSRIGGSVHLGRDFDSDGAVMLQSTEIVGDLGCEGAYKCDLACSGAKIHGTIFWLGLAHPELSLLDLREVNALALHDDRESWPRRGGLIINGFVYQMLALHNQMTRQMKKDGVFPLEKKQEPADRIAWLELQPGGEILAGQPWEQLASFFKTKGDVESAQEILYSYERHVHRGNLLWQAWTYPFDYFESFPSKIWKLTGILGVIGAIVFWRANRMKLMAPTDKKAFEGFRKDGSLPEHHPPFNPLFYALENVLPVVKLGQDAAWQPNPAPAPAIWGANRLQRLRRLAERSSATRWLTRLRYYSCLAFLRWMLILLGWVLGIILAGAIAAKFKL
jgi:hypothetical protein